MKPVNETSVVLSAMGQRYHASAERRRREPMPTPGDSFDQLVEIMRRLRAPDGCPWDREQTLQSLRPFLLEETYKALEAIDRNDRQGLCEELGDLLFEVVFLARVSEEAGRVLGGRCRGHGRDQAGSGGIRMCSAAKAPAVSADEVLEPVGGSEAAGSVRRRDPAPRGHPRAVCRKRFRGCSAPTNMAARAASRGFDWLRASDVVLKD